MKKVILLALLMPCPAFGQIVENFEHGSLLNWVQSTENHWNADTSASISGKYSLHHTFNNPDAGTDLIGLQTRSLHPAEGSTKWSFLLRYGYNPSSLNNWSVFLMSDRGPESMSADSETNGYALGVNFVGSDDSLRLWKVKGTKVTEITHCGINWQTDIGLINSVKIEVERSNSGNWIVSLKTLAGNSIGSGSGFDNELFDPGWFIVYYRYSATCDRLLWLDDLNIEGVFYEDSDPPVITSCEPSGKNSVGVTINEEIADGTMIPENISLNDGKESPVAIVKRGNLKFDIYFNSRFINRSANILNISNLCDLSGNCSQNVKADFVPVWAEKGDVIISEIMADPLPVVSLPGKEYIELTNRTKYPFNLKNWTLSTESQNSLIPSAIVPPAGIVIICQWQDTLQFRKFGRVIGLKQFPPLTDNGRIIYLSDSTGSLIHGVEYSSEWYGDDLKSNGGWSLEMIDTGFPFYAKENWTASVSKNGGTPGSANSVLDSNQDISFYGIQNVFPVDSTIINVRFSEPVFDLAEKIKDFKIGEKSIASLFSSDPLFRKYSFKLEESIQKTQIYHLVMPGDIPDFAGNTMQKNDYYFGIPEQCKFGDMVFNEILFNPFPGDQDYLELYNCSGKIIDASRLQLISINDVSGVKSEPVPVSDEERCILPGEYYAITTDKERISERYFSTDPDYLFETGSLPSMSDDKGHLILYNRELDKIDELVYTDDMQYSLLTSCEGVALEKNDPRNNSGEASNWHSATENSGWGTPGAPNSIFIELLPATNEVVFSTTKISPDADGYEDFLTIGFNLTGSGNIISVMVFDETGKYVRKIATNLLIGNDASVIWDGTYDDGTLVRTGIYIILTTIYNDSGKTSTRKKVCTVIRN